MVLLNNDGRNFAMSRAGRLRGGRRNANFFLIALQNLNRLYLPKSIMRSIRAILLFISMSIIPLSHSHSLHNNNGFVPNLNLRGGEYQRKHLKGQREDHIVMSEDGNREESTLDA